MVAYPAGLPCVSRVEGHAASLDAGLVRSPIEAGDTRQRRAHRALPHALSLVFVVPQELYEEWLTWVNANAYDRWVTLALPGLLAARAGSDTALVPVRFTSDIDAELIPAHRLWVWRCSVAAEWLPLYAALGPVPAGPWIDAGTPGAASPDWIIAGTPPLPSVDIIIGGTPLAPSALA
jgi:hypothetical protein